MNGRSEYAILAGLVAGAALSANIQAQTTDAALNALIKKGILTEQEAKEALADLERQKAKTAGEKPKAPPFVWQWGQEASLKLGGFLQASGEFGEVGSAYGNFSDNPSGGAAHVPLHNRFYLRRARLNVTGEFLENFDFKLEGDFSQADGIGGSRTGFSGTDLFVNWRQFPEANVKVGQYKAPFGREQLTPDTTIHSIERSQVTGAITPERQVGVQVWGRPLANLAPDHKDRLEYSFGIFNGNNRNIASNDDAWFMYAGRLTSTAYAGKLFGQDANWKLGGNGLYSRYAAGTRVSQTGNLLLNKLDGSLSGFTAPSSAEGRAWGVDQALTVGPFDLVAEYLEQKVAPKNSTGFAPFTANGYYVQAGWFFPGRKFHLVSKWESFNPGQAAGDNLDSVIGGVNYYLKGDHLKLMLNYVHTWSDYRRRHPGTGQDQFDMVIARAQIMF
jgi:phosphate-selective porin